MKTALQELLYHFNDAWSSPGDLWKPSAVIDKVESMLEKEKEQIELAFNHGMRSSETYFDPTGKLTESENYLKDTYGNDE